MRGKLTALQEAFTGYFADRHAFPARRDAGRVDAIDADFVVAGQGVITLDGATIEAGPEIPLMPWVALPTESVQLGPPRRPVCCGPFCAAVNCN